MLTFYLDNGVTITIRTSGTEPKIKYYTEAIGLPACDQVSSPNKRIAYGSNKSWQELDKKLIDVVWNMVNQLLEPEKNGLKARSD